MFFIHSADHSARGGHLRVGDRTDRGSGDHRPAGPGRCGRGRVVLADGLQEDAKRERAATTSDPSAQSDVYESRPNVRTISGLLNMIYRPCQRPPPLKNGQRTPSFPPR